MLVVRNLGAITSGVNFAATTATIPFDTVTATTNNRISFSTTTNAASMLSSGWYETHIEVTVESVAANTITVSLYADGVAIPGDFAVATLAANDEQTIVLDVPVKITDTSSSSIAALQWKLTASSAAVMNNAVAHIKALN